MKRFIDTLPIIDTHEHLPHEMGAVPEEERDLLNRWLRNYIGGDVTSAGMPNDKKAYVKDASVDIHERWRVLEPYWDVCKYTGYGKAARLTARDIYGIEDINSSTIEQLSEAHKEIYKKDFMYELMHERLHIEKAILDGFTGTIYEKDERLFVRAWRPPIFIGIEDHEKELGVNPKRFMEYEKKYGSIRSLDDWMDVFEQEYLQIAPHLVALKFAMAYMRSLNFEKCKYSLAKAMFENALLDWNDADRQGLIVFPKPLQDFMLHHILNVNKKYFNLPVQVHTGYQEGAGNIIQNSNPLHLNQLIMDYPGTHFDIFHIGWPFSEQALSMVKILQNTSLNFCWTNIISSSISKRMYKEALEVLPMNKICAFGGDHIQMDLVYGHLEIAKENLAYVLEELVKEKHFTVSDAEKCAYKLFYENPKRIYRL